MNPIPQSPRMPFDRQESLQNHLVVAALLATISFSAMTNPPGGSFSRDSESSDNRKFWVGESVLEARNFVFYVLYVVMNSFSLFSSLVVIILFGARWRGVYDNRTAHTVAAVMQVLAAFGIGFAYYFALISMSREEFSIAYVALFLALWGMGLVGAGYVLYEQLKWCCGDGEAEGDEEAGGEAVAGGDQVTAGGDEEAAAAGDQQAEARG